MPTRLHAYPSERARFFAQRNRRSLGGKARLSERATDPWMGWCPDLPPDMVGFRATRLLDNLLPVVTRARGRFIGLDAGHARIDPANLPLGSGRAITLLHQYRDGSAAPLIQRVAVAAGLGAGIGTAITPYRLVASAWAALTFTGGTGVTGKESDRETLLDAAIYPFGAPTRSTPINEPILIWCGGDDSGTTCRVSVTPDGAASPGNLGNWDELDRFSALNPFEASSCESFNGRMHFLRTREAGVRHDRRLRWSAPGTADPDPAERGAGFFDFRDFTRPGVRVETLGNKLAVYFQDGLAFMVPTSQLTDAYRPQIVSKSRGLLSTHSLVSISPILHFGLFSDGWYFVDVAGRWKEAGVIQLEETRGKHVELNKWKETFYEDLDVDNRHRIHCEYEPFTKRVYITYPNRVTQTMRVLVYDIDTDSTWPMGYGPTVWGIYDRELQEGVTYGDAQTAGTLYADYEALGTRYADLMPRFGFGSLVHGTTNGLVFGHDPTITARDGTEPSWLWESHELAITPDPLQRQTFTRLGVEYLDVRGGGAALTALTNGGATAQSQTVSLAESHSMFGYMQTAYAHFRLGGTHHGFRAAGMGPVLVRSWVPEFMALGVLDNEVG